MKLFFSQNPEKDQKGDQTDKLPVPFNESTQNITDGGEFLDDALRMKEQPFMYMEDCVAAGCFDGIL